VSPSDESLHSVIGGGCASTAHEGSPIRLTVRHPHSGGSLDPLRLEHLRLLHRAGLFPLPKTRPCMTYACSCECPDCKATAKTIRERGFTSDGKIAPPPPKRVVRQPWEIAA